MANPEYIPVKAEIISLLEKNISGLTFSQIQQALVEKFPHLFAGNKNRVHTIVQTMQDSRKLFCSKAKSKNKPIYVLGQTKKKNFVFQDIKTPIVSNELIRTNGVIDWSMTYLLKFRTAV